MQRVRSATASIAPRMFHSVIRSSVPVARLHSHTRVAAPQAQAAAAPLTATNVATPAQPTETKQGGPYQRSLKRTWHLFDARDQVVGRLAGRIATLLVGKHKPDYDPAHDHGDCVVVLNAKYLKFTGKKWDQKVYRYHTGYVGGLKEIPADRWRQSHPERILKHAVAGMIHKNKLKVPRLERLKIYNGLVHPHQAQFPGDVIAQIPALKAARDAELLQIAAGVKEEQEAIGLAASGKKPSAKPSVDASIQGPDDGTMPNDPEIKKAIIKDRAERLGKPVVML